MPAYTNTESRRQTHRHTDKQSSADNTALGFGPPEFSCLPVAGSPYRMASTVHQTWGNFFSRKIGCLPARPLASALRWLECLIHSPFIGRLSAESAASQRVRWPRPYAGWLSFIEKSFFCTRYLPAFQQGLRFTLDFPVLPEHWCFYLSFPSVLEVFSLPSQGIPDEPPNVLPDVRIPEREDRKLPKQCNSQKKGSLLLTRIRAPAARPTQWYGVREP